MSKAYSTQTTATAADATRVADGQFNLRQKLAEVINDVELGFNALEAKTGFPIINWIDGGFAAAAGGDIELNGSNLLGGQTFDSLQLTEGAADLTVYALTPGDSSITVTMTLGGGALAITYAAPLLTITLASGGSTDDAIATAINANAADTDGYIRAVSGGGGTFTASQANAPMTGGTGTYASNLVSITGVTCLPKNETGTTSTAKWSETQIFVTVPDLTAESDARAAGDTAVIAALVNGTYSNFVAGPLA